MESCLSGPVLYGHESIVMPVRRLLLKGSSFGILSMADSFISFEGKGFFFTRYFIF